MSSPKQEPSTPTKDDHSVPSSGQFIDSFRYFYPDRRNAFTCWSTVTGARQTNYGTRIDYIFADKELCYEEFVDCDIMPEVEGSDHCPVKAKLKGVCEASSTYPPLCTKFMPEFLGKQQKLSSFFKKVSPSKRFNEAVNGDKSKGTKRTNTVTSSAANKSKKKQKTGPASGSLLNFFQRANSGSNFVNSERPSKTNLVTSELPLEADCEPNNDQKLEDSKSANRLEDSKSGYSANNELSVQVQDNQDETDGDNSVSSSQEPVASENSVTQSVSSSQESTSSEKSVSKDSLDNKSKLSAGWKSIFKGLPPPPLCKGHKEPCVMRTVKKSGPNRGRRFYVCAKPEGHKSNPDARCDHFEWMNKKK